MSRSADLSKQKKDSEQDFRKHLNAILHSVNADFVLTEDATKCLLQISDTFLKDVIGGAIKIANLRGEATISTRDVAFYLEHAWDMKIPGYVLENKVAVTNIKAAEIEARRQDDQNVSKRRK
mmetsp:Transcript_45716/g.67504  ORF Transcript_45716/g.67504 Transcript_45716/m.67504 type:complete len:122 (+) Transcript_45716:79-444(+)